MTSRGFSDALAKAGATTHDAMSPEQRKLLAHAWLDALTEIRQLIPSGDMTSLYHSTTLRYGSHDRMVGKAVRFGFGAETASKPRRVDLWVDERLPSWYRTEQVETLVYAALRAHLWISLREVYERNDQLVALCKAVGCAWSDSGDHRLRLQIIGITHDHFDAAMDERVISSQVLIHHEMRPICRLCSRAVATGSEKATIHDECMGYARAVMIPALKIQQQREKAEDARD